MFFEVICHNSNPNINQLIKQRFSLVRQYLGNMHYRKTLNHTDDFLQKCFITPDGAITHKNNPKLFNQYAKLELRNKCPFESAMILCYELAAALAALSENSQPLSFAYTEEFTELPKIKISKLKLQQNDFYIDFGKRYIVEQ